MTDQNLTIITGASSGIGAAMAADAAAAGHTVATVSRRPGPGHHLAADLAKPEAWGEVASWIAGLIAEQTWNRVTLIHNAGTLDPIGFAGEVDHDAYLTNVLLNSASAQVLGDRFIASINRASTASGSNISAMLMMISSGAGKNPYPGWTSYCAGKAATDMWCRAAGLEQEMRGSAISVVSMAPGVVATDMQAMIRNQDETAFPNVARFHEMHDGGALGDPAEVGATIFELAQQSCDGTTFRGTQLTNGAVLDIRDLN